MAIKIDADPNNKTS